MTHTPHKNRHKPPYLRYTLMVALILFLGYQQSLISSLKSNYKTINSEQISLNQRIQELEGQNEQLTIALKQIDSRLGYMDSKVMETIEANNKRHTPSQIESPDDNPNIEDHPATEPTEEKEGFLNGLRRIFGN